MFFRMLKSIAIAAGATMAVKSLPDVARYLKIRQPEAARDEATGGVHNA